jgi:hypothetical protein
MQDAIAGSIRIIHLLSVVMLLGSAYYILFVEKGVERIPAWYVITPSLGVLGSGFWQFYQMLQMGVPGTYHMIFGIKFLFVMHILAVMLMQLRGQATEAKRKGWMRGIVVSGTLAVILATTMRLLRGSY